MADRKLGLTAYGGLCGNRLGNSAGICGMGL